MLIDHVYRSVQTLLNKNSKGTLTPERFNDLCRMSLNDMFMDLLNEKRQYMNRKASRRGGTRKQEVDKALARYLKETTYNSPVVFNINSIAIPDDFALFPNKYIFACMDTDTPDISIKSEIPEIPNDDYGAYSSGIVKPSRLYPQHKVINGEIFFYPIIGLNYPVTLYYYRYPKIPNWTYVVSGGVPVFNQSDPSFEDLDIYQPRSEELITKILVYAGLSIKEQMSVQVGAAAEQEDERNNTSV